MGRGVSGQVPTDKRLAIEPPTNVPNWQRRPRDMASHFLKVSQRTRPLFKFFLLTKKSHKMS